MELCVSVCTDLVNIRDYFLNNLSLKNMLSEEEKTLLHLCFFPIFCPCGALSKPFLTLLGTLHGALNLLGSILNPFPFPAWQI